ncbi:MAG: CCA tRNA nucleotidyltransferase [Candidatus Doudnabacteria bacterium]|nr:CCA tRNA nucleotidyltransferase [Candidatus Doudnabacteria bacterium]
MRYYFLAHTKLEKFGEKIFFTLVENFSQTFFVGGAVRDLLLKKSVTDIDIATEASPDEVLKLLDAAGILHDDSYKNFGVIVAKQGSLKVEIATLRKDLKTAGRYPKTKFVKSAKIDSQRRDFTINALYLSLKTNEILDFHNGLIDLKSRVLRFIGKPEKRIAEDPLRIIRALRFSLVLNFKLEKKSFFALKKYFYSVKNLTLTRINKELEKISDKKIKLLLKSVLDNKKVLDKHFK